MQMLVSSPNHKGVSVSGLLKLKGSLRTYSSRIREEVTVSIVYNHQIGFEHRASFRIPQRETVNHNPTTATVGTIVVSSVGYFMLPKLRVTTQTSRDH